MTDSAAPASGRGDVDACDRQPTAREHALVCHAMHVVERCARRVARQFPRVVRPGGLVTIEDLCSIGKVALYPLARRFKEEFNNDFADYAACRARFAMLDALGDLMFQERLKRATEQAEDTYCAHQRDDGSDRNMRDEGGLRRRFRAFATGQIAATLHAAIEEARLCADMTELAEREEYARTVRLLDDSLGHLKPKERALLTLMYRERIDLADAAGRLGIPYGTARRWHAHALEVLHGALTSNDVTRVPKPIVRPHVVTTLQSSNDNDAGGGDDE